MAVEEFHNKNDAERFKNDFVEAFAKRELRFWSYEDFIGAAPKKTETPEDNLPKKTTRRKSIKR